VGTPNAFDDFISRVDHPMVLITTVAGDVHAGCLVGFHSQCSIEPSRYAVWLSKANRTFRISVLAEVFALHFLEARNQDLAELFGTVTGDDDDKFEHCDWTSGHGGVRLLDGCRARITAERAALHDDGGDHACFVLAPIQTTAPTDFEPLAFSQVRNLDAGHEAGERQLPR
jgi:flavin reductase (DIM6/NTAB) family NADH-FMN oxidoreductase RutF